MPYCLRRSKKQLSSYDQTKITGRASSHIETQKVRASVSVKCLNLSRVIRSSLKGMWKPNDQETWVLWVKAAQGESLSEGSHAVLCVENGKSLSLLRTSSWEPVLPHPWRLVWTYHIMCVSIYPDTHTPPPPFYTHTHAFTYTQRK